MVAASYIFSGMLPNLVSEVSTSWVSFRFAWRKRSFFHRKPMFNMQWLKRLKFVLSSPSHRNLVVKNLLVKNAFFGQKFSITVCHEILSVIDINFPGYQPFNCYRFDTTIRNLNQKAFKKKAICILQPLRLFFWFETRGGQNSSRLKSGPDYLDKPVIIWTNPRFFSGPDRNLDFVWTKNIFFLQICPDWIQIQIETFKMAGKKNFASSFCIIVCRIKMRYKELSREWPSYELIPIWKMIAIHLIQQNTSKI